MIVLFADEILDVFRQIFLLNLSLTRSLDFLRFNSAHKRQDFVLAKELREIFLREVL